MSRLPGPQQPPKAHQVGASGAHVVHPRLAASPRNRPGPCPRSLAGSIAVTLEETGHSSPCTHGRLEGLHEMKQDMQMGSLLPGFLRPFKN